MTYKMLCYVSVFCYVSVLFLFFFSFFRPDIHDIWCKIFKGLDLNPENTTNHTCFSKKSLEVYILNEKIGFVFSFSLKSTTTFPCENFL